MKKLLISLMFVLLFLVGACGDDDKGNTGNTGDSGNTGNTGNTGDSGDIGNSGDTGNSGNSGDSGDSGDTGNTGDSGNTGNTGDTGNTGNSGDTGIEIPDDIGTMIDIPEGEFNMGCNEEVDFNCQKNEFPYHTVFLSAYKIDKYEVTTSEYQKCVDAGYCNRNNVDEPHFATNDTYCNLGNEGREYLPMNCVTWYGAKAYCEWAGKRLPTEAEWEKAARGTDGRKYPWGNKPEATCDYAVMDDSTAGGEGCGVKGVTVVGSKEYGKSPYGVYDMSGNANEWTNDFYAEDFYASSPFENPVGPETGTTYVVRGGSWSSSKNTSVNELRVSCRNRHTPLGMVGTHSFRCVK